MRISTAQIFQQATVPINQRQAELSELFQKISSGRAQLRPSEDPFAAARALDLEQVQTRTAQFQENIVFADARLGLEETTLGGVTNLLQRAHDLAVQANNGALSDLDRVSIAREIEERIAELVQLGNTVDANGDHLFAGFRGATQPLAARSIGDLGFVDYQGDQGRRFVQVSESRQVQDSDPGSEVFFAVAAGAGLRTALPLTNTGTGEAAPAYVYDPTLATGDTYRIQFNAGGTFDIVDETLAVNVATAVPYVDAASIEFDGIRTAMTGTPAAGDVVRISPAPTQDVFTTLGKFAATLRTSATTPADQAQVSGALGQTIADLDAALERVTEVRTRIGGRLNALEAQRDDNAAFALQTRRVVSELQDLDYAAAVSRLQQTLFALQAAQQSFARIENLSLFDFI